MKVLGLSNLKLLYKIVLKKISNLKREDNPEAWIESDIENLTKKYFGPEDNDKEPGKVSIGFAPKKLKEEIILREAGILLNKSNDVQGLPIKFMIEFFFTMGNRLGYEKSNLSANSSREFLEGKPAFVDNVNDEKVEKFIEEIYDNILERELAKN